MGTRYSQITYAQRVLIESGLRQKWSNAQIARQAGVHPSSIGREIERGIQHASGGLYLAEFGQRAHDQARRDAGMARRKLGSDLDSPAWRNVLDGMRLRKSPDQIAGELRRLDPLHGLLPAAPGYVSRETIYCAIYAQPRGALRTELISLLRRSRAGRRPRARGKARHTGLQEMTPISMRPAEVEHRLVPGHWEGDFMKGAGGRSAIGTLVERTSRYTLLAPMADCTAASALEGFSRRLRTVPEPLRRTLTYDQGSEMALHKTLARRLKIDIFFCEPYRPGQRGLNENTNGLLREFFPKGTDLSTVTSAELRRVEFLLNNRPRRILGYRTPQQVFDELCAEYAQHSLTPRRSTQRF
jgi:transposase, IS30 family